MAAGRHGDLDNAEGVLDASLPPAILVSAIQFYRRGAPWSRRVEGASSPVSPWVAVLSGGLLTVRVRTLLAGGGFLSGKCPI